MTRSLEFDETALLSRLATLEKLLTGVQVAYATQGKQLSEATRSLAALEKKLLQLSAGVASVTEQLESLPTMLHSRSDGGDDA